jgi:hypothetical protein
MADIVFVLGAGASKSAGVPMMAEFLDAAHKLYEHAPTGLSRDEFALAFTIIQHRLTRLHAKSVVDLDNIESVFGLVEMGRLIGCLPDTPENEIAMAARAIRRLLVETVEQYCLFDVGADSTWSPNAAYRTLVERTVAPRTPKASSTYAFVTFNYDIALDYAIHWNDLKIDYALDDAPNGGVPLLKLHGSLNWNSCLECGAIRALSFERIFQLQPQRRPGLAHKRPMGVLGGLTGIGSHCPVGVNTEPAVVPPTWNKMEYHAAFARVWHRATMELAQAREIHIVGYSMPESDVFFRDLLALSLEGPTRLERITVVNPDESVAGRIAKHLGQAAIKRFRPWSTRFEVFVQAESWEI